jgi:hypothetical protein
MNIMILTKRVTTLDLIVVMITMKTIYRHIFHITKPVEVETGKGTGNNQNRNEQGSGIHDKSVCTKP